MGCSHSHNVLYWYFRTRWHGRIRGCTEKQMREACAREPADFV